METKDKEQKITIQVTLTVNPDHSDLEDFLLYLPENLTDCLCQDENCVLNDELYDEDVKVIKENNKRETLGEIIRIEYFE